MIRFTLVWRFLHSRKIRKTHWLDMLCEHTHTHTKQRRICLPFSMPELPGLVSIRFVQYLSCIWGGNFAEPCLWAFKLRMRVKTSCSCDLFCFILRVQSWCTHLISTRKKRPTHIRICISNITHIQHIWLDTSQIACIVQYMFYDKLHQKSSTWLWLWFCF